MKLISIASLLVVVVAAMVDAQTYQVGAGGGLWMTNCDFLGGDIGNVRVSGEQCGRVCRTRVSFVLLGFVNRPHQLLVDAG